MQIFDASYSAREVCSKLFFPNDLAKPFGSRGCSCAKSKWSDLSGRRASFEFCNFEFPPSRPVNVNRPGGQGTSKSVFLAATVRARGTHVDTGPNVQGYSGAPRRQSKNGAPQQNLTGVSRIGNVASRRRQANAQHGDGRANDLSPVLPGSVLSYPDSADSGGFFPVRARTLWLLPGEGVIFVHGNLLHEGIRANPFGPQGATNLPTESARTKP